VSASFLDNTYPQVRVRLNQLRPEPTALPEPGGQQTTNVEEVAETWCDVLLIAPGQDALAQMDAPITRYQSESGKRLAGRSG
jgi:hypothetical protein